MAAQKPSVPTKKGKGQIADIRKATADCHKVVYDVLADGNSTVETVDSPFINDDKGKSLLSKWRRVYNIVSDDDDTVADDNKVRRLMKCLKEFMEELLIKALLSIGFAFEDKLKGRHVRTCGELWMISKGNMIHCSSKATVSHNFLRLKEGGIYYVKNFSVKPNKDEYRIIKNDAYMLEFDGSTTIRKASMKADGFLRYPFQLQDFDGIESSDNKYLIDFTEYVTNVERTNHLKSGSRNLDFHLVNHSLSPSTVRSPLMESGQGRDRTSLHVEATPAVVVMFNETATALVNCSAESLMDIVDESSEDHLNLSPALSNLIGTAHVMEIKSHTYYEYWTFESFTCWQILTSEGIDDIVGSSNLDDYLDNQPQKMKRIV
nr:hypothetical protein [Tanacetum cinerariifolium]